MEHPTGYWQSVEVPRLGEKVSRITWKSPIGLQQKRPAAGGDENSSGLGDEPTIRVPDSDYPSGKPLTESEKMACRNHRPKSITDGK